MAIVVRISVISMIQAAGRTPTLDNHHAPATLATEVTRRTGRP
jgi:hypothetical protein